MVFALKGKGIATIAGQLVQIKHPLYFRQMCTVRIWGWGVPRLPDDGNEALTTIATECVGFDKMLERILFLKIAVPD